jgi:hypothetical protein
MGNDVTCAVRDQMKNLSQEIFGSTSKWQKLYKFDETLKHTIVETIPGEGDAPATTKEVEVPLYVEGTKVKQMVRKYRTTEEVLSLLLMFKQKRDAYIENMKKMQAEALAKRQADEAAKKLQSDFGGSAV